ncbi:beta-lactoglobulin isoform X2 [Phacochoerus africanus]|uniref:beta-lactoglobulin isoform X2 n=1 Tax=Phacochoerus africanus TaxID=41426 RepID=UPI001FD92A83|nr:beta-lactoglobulin isoform X2 [Phacochoerus africanus]
MGMIPEPSLGQAGTTSGPRGTGTKKGHGLPGLSFLWGTAVMALGRRPLLLLTLSLGLAGAQKSPEDVPVQPGFDAQKVEGRWLTIQLAASRAHLVSPADPLWLALHSIWTRGQDVELVLFGIGEGVCQGLSVIVHPTGLRGQYRGPLEGGGSLLLHFVGTDYSHLILYVRFQDGGEATSLWALLARRHLEDPQWQGRYLEFVSKFQLQEAPVFNLDDRDAQCPPPEA